MLSDFEDNLLEEVLEEKAEQEKAQGKSLIPRDGEYPADHEDSASPPPLKRNKNQSTTENKSFYSQNEEKLVELVFGNKEKFISDLEKVTTAHQQTSKTKDREAVWHDSCDEDLDADDAIDYKLRDAPAVRKSGKYKKVLEKNFKTILGTPDWANLDRKKESDNDDSDEEILRTVGHVRKDVLHEKLSKSRLQYKQIPDLNRATYAEGPGITSVEFHPTSSVAVVTGLSGIASIYSIDGKNNDKLHSVDFKNFPIKCCRLNASGMEAIIGGSKNYFYTYDLLSGENQRIFLPKTMTKMSAFEMSPCGGIIAVVGRFGEIHLMSSSSKELIHTLKQEHPSTSLAFSVDSSKLFAHSCDTEINVFDLKMHRVHHRFIDDGCVNGSTVSLSPDGQLLAAGSEQGVVNIYNVSDTLESKTPTPLKTIFNLTTSITATKFNHSSEILAISSNHLSNGIKMIHLPSATVFSNFPDFKAQLGKITNIAFSPQSGYMAMGTTGKKVPLFRLKHFNNY